MPRIKATPAPAGEVLASSRIGQAAGPRRTHLLRLRTPGAPKHVASAPCGQEPSDDQPDPPPRPDLQPTPERGPAHPPPPRDRVSPPRVPVRPAARGATHRPHLGRGQGPPRRQGRQPRRDDPAGAPGAARASPSPPRPAARTSGPGRWPQGLWDAEVDARCASSSSEPGKRFGDPSNPLLVSCRSGAKFSMPGMMDTVLNIGLNAATVTGPGEAHRRPALRLGRLPPPGPDVRHAWCWGCRDEPLRAGARRVARPARRGERRRPRRRTTSERSPGASGRSSASSPAASSRTTPLEQLRLATEAVFRSWQGKRAQDYRQGRRHPRRPRHRGEHRGHGVRQHGRRQLGHRRRHHPQRLHRREGARGRLPAQRPGRGRGGRHPRHPAHRRAGGGHARGVRGARSASPGCSRSTTARCRTSSSRSSGARCGCSRPATPSAPPGPR